MLRWTHQKPCTDLAIISTSSLQSGGAKAPGDYQQRWRSGTNSVSPLPAAALGPWPTAVQGCRGMAAEGKCTHSTRLMKATEKQGRLHTAAGTSRRNARQLLHVPVRDAEPGQPPVDSVRGQASTRLTAASAPSSCLHPCL